MSNLIEKTQALSVVISFLGGNIDEVALYEKINSLPLQQQWIPVSERLPDEWKEYMVFSPCDGVSTREWDTDQSIWIHGDRQSIYSLNKITHWQSLPLPPNN